MKRITMIFLLVISMFLLSCNCVFAESFNDGGFDTVSEENIEQNTTLFSENDGEVVEESYIAENEQILDTEPELAIKSLEETEQAEVFANEIDEIETLPIVEDEESTEQQENEEEIEQIEITEPVEEQAEEQEEASEIEEKEEIEQVEVVPTVEAEHEPSVFIYTPSLSLYRGPAELAMYAFTDIVNSTGMPVALKGVLIQTINGWQLVDEDEDFLNLLVDSKDFRLYVEGQLILDTGYTPFDTVQIIPMGESIRVGIKVEMGGLSKALSEGIFGIQLVFEEVIEYEEKEVVEEVIEKVDIDSAISEEVVLEEPENSMDTPDTPDTGVIVEENEPTEEIEKVEPLEPREITEPIEPMVVMEEAEMLVKEQEIEPDGVEEPPITDEPKEPPNDIEEDSLKAD